MACLASRGNKIRTRRKEWPNYTKASGCKKNLPNKSKKREKPRPTSPKKRRKVMSRELRRGSQSGKRAKKQEGELL